MKKSLVALAALAVVGAASAQSSVTLYGVVDAGVGKSSGGTFQMIGSAGMNNGTSRFGFKGSEDLGGGLKALFNMEGGFHAETGAGNTSGGQLFSRAANLSLAGNFGEFRLGRSLTPSFYGIAAWELTGTANYSAVANSFNFANQDSRQSSQFMYVSPNFSGFSGAVAYTAKADNKVGANTYVAINPATGAAVLAKPLAPAAAGADAAKLDANLIYNAGPLAVGFSANRIDTAVATNNYSLGAKYNFGMFQVAGSLQDPSGASKGFTIGAGANLGPVALVVDIARDTNAKDTDLLLEAKYPLSKRTFAYAAYLRDGEGKETGTAGLPGFKAAGLRYQHVGVGIRHNF